ncbi:hypothetical protein ABH963_002100 [Bacillus sp. RC55]
MCMNEANEDLLYNAEKRWRITELLCNRHRLSMV